MTGLLIFPCCAILWLIICDWLGWVQDEPQVHIDLEAL